jgi:ligand-binding SRPBCC domain-containing protein
MSRITLSLWIDAPIERCFDLSRSIDLHLDAASATDERAVDGVTSGLIGPGEEVTWEALHLGVRQRLTSRIVMFDRPHHFRDTMVRGAFRHFDHDHRFMAERGGTRMTDVFDFSVPFGVVGRLVDRLILHAYMRRFLEERNRVIQRVAESEEWRRYLPS